MSQTTTSQRSSPILGNSPELQAVVRAAELVAATDVTVLICGATGTGKELMARHIHDHSARSDKPFVAINSAALPTDLVEASLFGHRRGAFTGATDDSPGFIGESAGGTLFLDEIAELPLGAQAKLLRFLESGECQPVGKSQPVHYNTRVIAACNADLQERVRAGSFREDLYYRLNIVPLELPTLQQRQGDIPVLLEAFIGQVSAQRGLPPPAFSRDAMHALTQYRWPGNVRELRNFCERMVIFHPGMTVTPSELPRDMQPQSPLSALSESFLLPAGGLHLESLEVSLIEQAMAATHGNKSRAARMLGLTRDTFLYRLKKYGLFG